jgi:hypothetical protein
MANIAGLHDTYARDVLSLTYHNMRKDIIDAFFSGNVILYKLKSKLSKGVSGGLDTVVYNVQRALNPTVGSRSPYIAIPNQEYDFLTKVMFPWGHINGSITVMDEDARVNRAPNLLRPWIQDMVQNTKDTFANIMASQVVEGGTSGLLGLDALIDDDNSCGYYQLADESWAALDRSVTANSWWRAIVEATGGAFDTDGAHGLRHTYLTCTNGQAAPDYKPDIILTSLDLWEAYAETLTPNQRFSDPDLAKVGFDNLEFMGATMHYDSTIDYDSSSGGSIYIVNTRMLEMLADSQCIDNLIKGPWTRLDGGVPGEFQQLSWHGQLTTKNPRYLGKMTGVTRPA